MNKLNNGERERKKENKKNLNKNAFLSFHRAFNKTKNSSYFLQCLKRLSVYYSFHSNFFKYAIILTTPTSPIR